MTEADLMARRDDANQICLDLIGVGGRGEPEALREARHVRIDADCRYGKGIAEQDVGGLAADSRQGEERVPVARDLAAKSVDEGLAAGANGLGLLPEKAGRPDPLLELTLGHLGEIARGAQPPKETRGHLVHAGIGALGGENERDQQLERRAKVEGQAGIGMGPRQGGDERADRGGGPALRSGRHGDDYMYEPPVTNTTCPVT